MFERLFEKIEQQRAAYGDQVYDVLGDSQINTSLRELLLKAIVTDDDPAHAEWMDEVIDGDIGRQLEDVLNERALVAGLGNPTASDDIRRRMEIARARKLHPWFVESFFTEALRLYGGRIASREQGRFEITRIPATIRAHADPNLGTVHDRYERVTFDKATIHPNRNSRNSGGAGDRNSAGGASGAGGANGADTRACLISPGTALLAAVIRRVLTDHGHTLQRGAVLVDCDDPSTEPRLLVYLDHAITDGRHVNGGRQVVSRRLRYVEIDQHGSANDPGDEPYLNYATPTGEQRSLLAGRLDLDWADHTAEQTARAWAIEHLAGPHFDDVASVTRERVAKVSEAVRERLESEIRYWDRRTNEIKAQEIAGRKPRLNSGRARARANELEDRLTRRRWELSLEADLHNSPPTVIAAAVVAPQGLIDRLAGRPGCSADPAVKAQTDRRAVAAVMKAERALGRTPQEQHHSNPGYDVLSTDPATGVCYFIEVKGRLPHTEQISVSRRQVGQAQCNPQRWRLAVVTMPDDHGREPDDPGREPDEPDREPEVRYLIEPFQNVALHPAQTSVPLNAADLLAHADPPR